MKIYINKKSFRKKRHGLTQFPYEIHDQDHTLKDLLLDVVEREVKQYNDMGSDAFVLLSEEELDEMKDQGKVIFDNLTEHHADLLKAQETVLENYQDGMIKVLLNDQEIQSLDQEIEIKEGDVLTFIRLTFLAGRMW